MPSIRRTYSEKNDHPATKGDAVYRDVKVAILSGKYKPGQLISANRLAKEFGVARSVVCESLARLRAESFVRNEGAYSRTYVEEPDLPLVVEHYEVREVLEGAAARLAAQNMNVWQVAELRRLADRAAAAPADSEAAMEANLAFHQYLVANCGNALLSKIYEIHHLAPIALRSYSRLEDVGLPEKQTGNDVFKKLCDAISARDGESAEACIRRDLRDITEKLRTIASSHTADPSKRSY